MFERRELAQRRDDDPVVDAHSRGVEGCERKGEIAEVVPAEQRGCRRERRRHRRGRDDLVLLVGGLDRGVDYAPLADFLAAHPIAGLIGLPDSGPHILATLAVTAIPAIAVPDMDAALVEARRLVPSEGVVLLSPAAPSFGRYRDFADRAADFRRAIVATAPSPIGENQ